MGQPFGFQGFEIIPDLKNDWHGTWEKLASYGYSFVDQVTYSPRQAPNLAALTPKEIREGIEGAGLKIYNCHFSYDDLTTSFDKTMETAHILGLKTMVCQPGPRRKTADDWKWEGDQMNQIAVKVMKAGFGKLGYHNHEAEFVPVEGQKPFDILMANTDPKLVSFQIDVGNLTFGGSDPVEYLEKYAGRYWSLHVKDFVKGKASVPVGSGDLDWKRIFALAKQQNILSYVAEVGAYGLNSLDGVPLEKSPIPILESFRLSAVYLKSVNT